MIAIADTFFSYIFWNNFKYLNYFAASLTTTKLQLKSFNNFFVYFYKRKQMVYHLNIFSTYIIYHTKMFGTKSFRVDFEFSLLNLFSLLPAFKPYALLSKIFSYGRLTLCTKFTSTWKRNKYNIRMISCELLFSIYFRVFFWFIYLFL